MALARTRIAAGSAAVIVAALSTAVVAGSNAAASPPPRVVTSALGFLAPSSVKGPVVVYALPTPLAARTVVTEAGPSGKLDLSRRRPDGSLTTPVRSWRVGSKTWLFWEDLDPGAFYVHPSKLVLVADATGKVTTSATLGWYPLVNGKPPAFLKRPTDRRFQVYSNLPKRTLAAVQATERRLQSLARPARGGFEFEQDCIVMMVDETDSLKTGDYLRGDLKAVTQWATANNLPIGTAKTARDLGAEVELLRKAGCNDVVIYLAGHGFAKPGTTFNNLPLPSSDVATVSTGITVTEGSSGTTVTKNLITSTDIADLVKSYTDTTLDSNGGTVTISHVHFKLIVMSCFSDRFRQDLAPYEKVDATHPDPPIREIATSSDASRPTAAHPDNTPYDATNTYMADDFTLGLLNALKEVAGRTDPGDKGDLAAMINEAMVLVGKKPRKYGDLAAAIGFNRHHSKYAAGPRHPLGEPRIPPPPPAPVFHIHAKFYSSDRLTRYTLVYAVEPSSAPFSYLWQLTPPGQGQPPNPPDSQTDPLGCANQAPYGSGLTSTGSSFTWYHGPEICTHAIEDPLRGHKGTVAVTVKSVGFTCTASYYGTQGADGSPEGDSANATCQPT